MKFLSIIILFAMTLSWSEAEMDYSCQPGIEANPGGNYMIINNANYFYKVIEFTKY